MQASIGYLTPIVGKGRTIEVEDLNHSGNEGAYLAGVFAVKLLEGWEFEAGGVMDCAGGVGSR